VTLFQRKKNIRARYIDVSAPSATISGSVEVIALISLNIHESVFGGSDTRASVEKIPLTVPEHGENVIWHIVDDWEGGEGFTTYWAFGGGAGTEI